ncbi:hypothetical protein C8046_09715 [Serinibacter arcticus]|uniref:TfoX N-terminal domain-containing protein n=1 Tax=Serinibacter arcticus TaxID=1655435 RepID=A0A2U1ZV68_9MICO|nr:TfoX/Sxy family protein [Serinibacter arcticus]PWD50887.1 hypothetical protein C8046_09715 [Serinibacter arcticus]
MAVTHPAQAAVAERLRRLLAGREVGERRMFGGLAFMVDDRLTVSVGRDGDLLVRVDPVEYEALLERGAVTAIMGVDRPMGRRWLTVPAPLLDGDAELESWLAVGHRGALAAG